jgi:hypothetical protein
MYHWRCSWLLVHFAVGIGVTLAGSNSALEKLRQIKTTKTTKSTSVFLMCLDHLLKLLELLHQEGIS